MASLKQIPFLPVPRHSYIYFEKISSSVFVLGLAKVSIFQLIFTELKSVILTSLMEVGQGSANWQGISGTLLLLMVGFGCCEVCLLGSTSKNLGLLRFRESLRLAFRSIVSISFFDFSFSRSSGNPSLPADTYIQKCIVLIFFSKLFLESGQEKLNIPVNSYNLIFIFALM